MQIEPGRSSIIHKTLSWMKEYVTCAIKQPTSHTAQAFPYTTPSLFSLAYINFLCAISYIEESHSYEEAKSS